MMEKRILVVDDEMEIRHQIIDCFDEIEANYTFYAANNGFEAIKIAQEKKPDIILTDWEMSGMSGIELIKQLKSNNITQNIPVIMITGVMTSSDNLKTSFEAGAIDFIRKPIDKIELIARVRSMLMLADYYEQTLEFKNRELTQIALNIVHNNEFNLGLRKEVAELEVEFGTKNKQLATKLEAIKHELSLKLKNEAWQQFDNYYQQSNPDFFKKLSEHYPDLTPSELKLCAFLRLNLQSKEIASLLCLNQDSVKTLRSRIRKKMNLNSNESLFNFLIGV